MKRLEAKGICKRYSGVDILKDVNVFVNEGELVSVLGVSGAGKTTLFNVLSGLELPEAGQVLLQGRDITGKPGNVSYMLQKDLLLPYRKVVDNVALPLLIGGMPKKEARAKAAAYFAEFAIDGCQEKYPRQLSGGMRQRAALLRTYLASKGVALLDEPFSALDTITKSAIHKWYLQMMAQLDLATFFITHDIDESILLSDRIYILAGRPGTISREIVVDRQGTPKAEFNLDPRFLEYKKIIMAELHL